MRNYLLVLAILIFVAGVFTWKTTHDELRHLDQGVAGPLPRSYPQLQSSPVPLDEQKPAVLDRMVELKILEQQRSALFIDQDSLAKLKIRKKELPATPELNRQKVEAQLDNLIRAKQKEVDDLKKVIDQRAARIERQ